MSSLQWKELDRIIQAIRRDPDVLWSSEASLFREYLQELNAKLPPEPQPPVAPMDTEPKSKRQETPPEPEADAVFDDEELPPLEHIEFAKKEEESEPEPKAESRFATEEDFEPLQMGDPDKEVTDEMMNRSMERKSEAQMKIAEGKLDEAVELLTQGILDNPHFGILYATRGDLLWKLKRPKASLIDCDQAIKMNPDSAKAYRVRGKVHHHLGNFKECLPDLRKAQQYDYMEDVQEMLKDAEERIHEMEAQEKKKKQADEREAKRKKAGGLPEWTQEAAENIRSAAAHGRPPAASKNMPSWVTPQMLQMIAKDPEIMAAFEDPEIMRKLTEMGADPSKVAQYASDPKLMGLFMKFANVYKSGMPAGGQTGTGAPPAGGKPNAQAPPSSMDDID